MTENETSQLQRISELTIQESDSEKEDDARHEGTEVDKAAKHVEDSQGTNGLLKFPKLMSRQTPVKERVTPQKNESKPGMLQAFL